MSARLVLGPLPCKACRMVVAWVNLRGRLGLYDAAGERKGEAHACPALTPTPEP